MFLKLCLTSPKNRIHTCICSYSWDNHSRKARVNYYKVLDVSHDASTKDVKKAYFEKSKQFHPDLNKSQEAKKRYNEIREAYEILGDNFKRRQYDHHMKVDTHGKSYSDYEFDKAAYWEKQRQEWRKRMSEQNQQYQRYPRQPPRSRSQNDDFSRSWKQWEEQHPFGPRYRPRQPPRSTSHNDDWEQHTFGPRGLHPEQEKYQHFVQNIDKYMKRYFVFCVILICLYAKFGPEPDPRKQEFDVMKATYIITNQKLRSGQYRQSLTPCARCGTRQLEDLYGNLHCVRCYVEAERSAEVLKEELDRVY